MEPSEVRSRVMDDHAELRRLLDEVEVMAIRFEQGHAEVAGSLREKGKHLYERLAQHLDLEDRILAPALRAVNPSGRQADRLAHEHREQRELLAYLLGRLEKTSMPTTLVARELRNFVGYVRFDMVHEENVLLPTLEGVSP